MFVRVGVVRKVVIVKFKINKNLRGTNKIFFANDFIHKGLLGLQTTREGENIFWETSHMNFDSFRVMYDLISMRRKDSETILGSTQLSVKAWEGGGKKGLHSD